ncbi:hypothetical protein [Pseudomonas zhanjiangensis]|uniref:Uncharacterized protein n=1 Tax=Pseudomonas zhanjiangensis TaxID=3239015 RepID=A0ABV3YZB0_9PSED
MSFAVAIKAVVIWLAILVVAVLNGLLRETVLVPHFAAATSLVLSGLLLSCLIFVAAYLLLPWLGTRVPAQLLLIGVGWLVLTLIFEFSFGLSQGKPLSEILQAYAFKGGNIWPLVLLCTAVSPWLAAKLRGWF